MFDFDSIITKINTYLSEDRQLQKSSNMERAAGNEELARELFAAHLQLEEVFNNKIANLREVL